jgi:hypothetical protein
MSYSQALLHFKGFHAIEVRQLSLLRSVTQGAVIWRCYLPCCEPPSILVSHPVSRHSVFCPMKLPVTLRSSPSLAPADLHALTPTRRAGAPHRP